MWKALCVHSPIILPPTPKYYSRSFRFGLKDVIWTTFSVTLQPAIFGGEHFPATVDLRPVLLIAIRHCPFQPFLILVRIQIKERASVLRLFHAFSLALSPPTGPFVPFGTFLPCFFSSFFFLSLTHFFHCHSLRHFNFFLFFLCSLFSLETIAVRSLLPPSARLDGPRNCFAFSISPSRNISSTPIAFPDRTLRDLL